MKYPSRRVKSEKETCYRRRKNCSNKEGKERRGKKKRKAEKIPSLEGEEGWKGGRRRQGVWSKSRVDQSKERRGGIGNRLANQSDTDATW